MRIGRGKKRWLSGAVLLIALVAAPFALSQQPGSISELEEKIEELQAELARARQNAERLADDETEQRAYLKELGTQISKTEQLLNAYSRDIERLNGEVDRLQRDIGRLDGEIVVLREAVAGYVADLYKHGRHRTVETILGSESFTQAVRRLKGLTVVARRQHQSVEELARTRNDLADSRAEMVENLASIRQRQQASRREQRQLAQARQKTEGILDRIAQDKQQVQQAIEEANAEIARLIEEKQELLRRRRAAGLPLDIELGGFEGRRGRMPWPLSSTKGGGTVVRRFGRLRGVDGTVTRSPGIDILAPDASTRIVAVHNAVVLEVHWLEFLGTVIILDHGDGYATVYTNAENLRVGVDDPVPAGFDMGTVGRSLRPAGDEPDGHLLRFSIYGQNGFLDPMPWFGETIAR
ncbi:MAG: peptidoglycan DD-metalloendopeptidase family protein [bacterium]